MAEIQHLSDILSEIGPLVADTMNYELRLRGIQPAQAPTTKRVQLARELLKEKQGNGYSFQPVMTLEEDLRSCASLFVRFEASLNSATRTTVTIENALTNLAFLQVRIERLNPQSQIQQNELQMLKINVINAIRNGKEILENINGNFTPQEEIIDLLGNRDSPFSPTEQLNIQPLFASLSLNDPNVQRVPQNAFQNAHGNQFSSQSHFNQHVPLSSTNSHVNNANPHVQSHRPMNFAYENIHQPNQHYAHNVQPNFLQNFDENQNETYTVNPNAMQSHIHPNFNHNQNFVHSHTPRRDHKIYKWKVKFTG